MGRTGNVFSTYDLHCIKWWFLQWEKFSSCRGPITGRNKPPSPSSGVDFRRFVHHSECHCNVRQLVESMNPNNNRKNLYCPDCTADWRRSWVATELVSVTWLRYRCWFPRWCVCWWYGCRFCGYWGSEAAAAAMGKKSQVETTDKLPSMSGELIPRLIRFYRFLGNFRYFSEVISDLDASVPVCLLCEDCNDRWIFAVRLRPPLCCKI